MSELSSPISEIIRQRIKEAGEKYFASDNISAFIHEGELELLQFEVSQKIQNLLDSLIIDTNNDHNTKETARRVAKLYIQEVFSGRYLSQPNATEFPNAKQFDELYIISPITVRSACSHHLVPIVGTLHIGVMPGENVLGLSKFNRIASWIMQRPHIQEEATVILADTLEEIVKPKGLGIVMCAHHMCCSWRGVKDNSQMITSVMRGSFRDPNNRLKEEFLKLIEKHLA